MTIEAMLRLVGSLYDVGWYVAGDEGDALTGTCLVGGLLRGDDYSVDGSSEGDGGVVSWCEDGFENDNNCGDMTSSCTTTSKPLPSKSPC